MSRGFDQETTLGTCWSKRENNWMIYYPRNSDGWAMHDFIRSEAFKEFVTELDNRGYDTQSLRLSIKKKKEVRENEL